ncbi:MAG TPA: extracellular solute-binding protein [Xanthobacteraceae bacterium]|jgi:iron(III) transport system substrate-binding protein
MAGSKMLCSAAAAAGATIVALLFFLPAAHAITTAEILDYRGTDRQQVLEAGARKEGALVIYSGMIVNQLLRPLLAKFESKYPFIKTRYWRGDGNQVIVKVHAELQANALEADLVEGSGMPGKIGGSPIVLPFYSPLFAALSPQEIAPDRTWAATRLRYIGLGYNTKLVSVDQAPKSYADLTDPKWKGKMAWHVDSDASGALVTISTLLASWGERATGDYLAKLATQAITPLAVSNRQVVDEVILGEYAIGLGISAHHPIISARRGAPSATVMLDPVPSLIDSIQVLRGTKHPHAAMLFVDFILSGEAQRLIRAAEYFPSNREVDPLPALASIVPRNAGVSDLVLSTERLEQLTPRSVELYKRYFH